MSLSTRPAGDVKNIFFWPTSRWTGTFTIFAILALILALLARLCSLGPNISAHQYWSYFGPCRLFHIFSLDTAVMLMGAAESFSDLIRITFVKNRVSERNFEVSEGYVWQSHNSGG